MRCLCKGRKGFRNGSTPGDQDASPQDTEGDTFPRMNWVMVLMLQFLMGIIYCILIPSMHQLVVSPTKAPASSSDSHGVNETFKETDTFWPGLGLSEVFYSWTVSAYSIGEIFGAPVAGYMTKYIPYRYTIMLTALTLAVGLLLYALTIQGWMIIVARLLIGIHTGFDLVLVTTYLGETAIEVTAKREAVGGKRDHSGTTLKDKLFIWYSFVTNGSYLSALVLCSIMAQFSQVDPYRSSAWLVLIITTVYIIVFLVVFKEDRPFRLPKCPGNHSTTKEEKRQTCSQEHRRTLDWRHKCKDFMLYAFLVTCGFVSGAMYTVMDTLLNPILSDQFGFSIVHSSYFILGITCLLVGTAGLLYVLKKLHVNNRKVFMISLCCAIIGGFVMSDWQSIGNDPCLAIHSREPMIRELPQTNEIGASLPHAMSSELQQSTANYTAFQFREACEAMSTPEDQCHWNPVSLFTGQYCQTCRPVCRSMRRSLNFFQFCVGISLMTISIPIAMASSTVIASDFVSLEMQGTIMGLMFTAQGLGRVIYPLWVDAAYEASDKHTYLPMTINGGTLILVLVVFAVLYKQLAPRTYSVNELESVNASTVEKTTVIKSSEYDALNTSPKAVKLKFDVV